MVDGMVGFWQSTLQALRLANSHLLFLFSFGFDCGLTFYQIGIIGEGRGWTDGWMDGNKVDGL
jgi:hypothetical protein